VCFTLCRFTSTTKQQQNSSFIKNVGRHKNRFLPKFFLSLAISVMKTWALFLRFHHLFPLGFWCFTSAVFRTNFDTEVCYRLDETAASSHSSTVSSDKSKFSFKLFYLSLILWLFDSLTLSLFLRIWNYLRRKL
jgi:hypothetical protein